MSKIVNQSLQKIAKGTGIIFIGTIIGTLLGFVSRIIIVRYITQSEYGIYSLAFVLMSIFVTISTLGLQQGSTRYIAYFRGKNEEGKVRGVISASIKIAIIASVISALILFLSSDVISMNIFHNSELSTPLKIFSAAIPFTVLITIFISLFRGFDRVEPNVYFQNIIRNVLFISFLVGAVLLGLSFIGVLYAYLASILLTCIAFAIYAIKKLPLTSSVKKDAANSINPMGKELLVFSLPLLAVAMLNMIMSWTDTLMLGYFKTPDVVGLYNAALPLAHLIPIALTSMVFIYTPIITQLYPKNLLQEIKRSYAILTKWVFSVTLPIFLIFVLFPDTVLSLLFGSQYIGAATALQFLALGFFVHVFLGPNASTLMAMGKTKILMGASLASAVLNVVLNVSLIPQIGITGAAIATASSLVLVNVVVSTKLYTLSGIHPFTKNYLKPIIASITLILVVYTVAKTFFIITVWHLFPLFLLFIIIYGLSLLLTKSFDQEDISMLLTIEKTAGIDASPIKRILKRFL
jgi:O-antigen/teichoic acid export membrane protein